MSDVYYANMRVKRADTLGNKMVRLIHSAGLTEEMVKDRYVAIKTTFGEYGNATFLKPFYVRTIAEEITRMGGHPFVTDSSTLYYGLRSNALDHLKCAALNGFTRDSCACEILIADGLRGTDEVDLPVPAGGELEVAHFGRALMDADLVITLTHAKGCMASGYAGSLKNMGMGGASRAGKMVQHGDGLPHFNEDACTGCMMCSHSCGVAAISYKELPKENGKKRRVAEVDPEVCVGCGHCISFCPSRAISGGHDSWPSFQRKMAEYAAAFQAAQKCFHVAIAIDITPGCDCFADTDSVMVPNVGMFASFDPVALDQAVIDEVSAQPDLEHGPLHDLRAAAAANGKEVRDNVSALNPDTDWRICLTHAEELGAGSREYNLITVE